MNSSSSSSDSAPSALPRARFSRRSFVWTGAFVLTLSLTATYLATRGNAAPVEIAEAAPAGPKVTVATAEEKLFIDERELLGRVEARETVEVRPRVSGHLAEVRLQAGQLVNAGDVLFVIDRRWYQAQFELATAQTETARVRFAIAEREAKRVEALLKHSVVSVEEADTRTSRLAEARAELRAAEAQLASARLDLEHTEVRAPISGRISRAFVTTGNLVSGAAGSATVLATIVSTGDVYVYADVDEATVLNFNRLQRAGRLVTEHGRVPVVMQLSDESGFPHRGYVESSDNRLDAATGSLVVRFVFPNDHGDLIPGLSARVRVPVGAPEKAIFVSERAIGTDQSQKFVLTVDKANTVAYRSVKLGPIVSGERVVLDGLKVGDRIIVNGLQRARPGMTVVAETAAPNELRKPATSVAFN